MATLSATILSSPVAWTADGKAFKSQESSLPSSSWMTSSSSALKTPLNQQQAGTSSRAGQFGNGSCGASRTTLDSGVHYSSMTPVKFAKPATLYDVLGISDMVTDVEIKAAFRRMAKEVHPDQAPPGKVQEYQKRFLEVHEAYSVLKNPQSRSLYNHKIRISMPRRKQFRVEDWRKPSFRGYNWETDQCWTS